MSRLCTSILVALVALSSACGDDTAGPTQPAPDAGRFDGPVDPCEVAAPAGNSEGEPVSLADALRPVTLAPLRENHPRGYSAQIPGSSASELLSGVLPDGLVLAQGEVSGSAALGTSGGANARIYVFTVAADDGVTLEVSLAVYPPGALGQGEVPHYWEPGPYPVWSTQPLESCSENPVIPFVGTEADVDMYVVYPTVGDPTVTGQGPVAQGRWPVVVFAHANNDRVCDINEKYLSLHDHWASWGFIVVAVDGTFTNCNRGSTQNIELRSEGQLSSLQVLEQLANDPESRFFGRVDLDRVVMAGHSRGGGASLVSLKNDDRVRAVIDLQGVDMTSFGFGSDPLPAVPVLGMTAGEDVDLNYPIVEPTEDQLSGIYTWVNINGGIHAYTADTAPIEPDDVPLIGQQQQHDITEYFTTAFLARFVGVGDGSLETPFAPDPRADAVLFSDFGARTVDESISSLGVYVRWNRRMASGLLIDDFDGPQTGSSPDLNAQGGLNTFEGFELAEEVETYSVAADGSRPQVYRKATSLLLSAGVGSTGTFRTILSPEPNTPVIVGRGDLLQARVKGPDGGDLGVLEVQIETPRGAFDFEAEDFLGPEDLSDRFSQLSIPFDDIFGPEEAAEVISVAFRLSSGSVYLDDLRID